MVRPCGESRPAVAVWPKPRHFGRLEARRAQQWAPEKGQHYEVYSIYIDFHDYTGCDLTDKQTYGHARPVAPDCPAAVVGAAKRHEQKT